MKMNKIFILAGALCCLWPVVAQAELTWKKTTISYQAKPEDESVTALYHFANTGTTPVKILSTKTSCGCTVAKLDKDVYTPNELGVLRVKFTFGDRTGPQTKQVQMYTDDPRGLTYLLTLQVDIPEFLTVEPQLLFWTRGEPAMKKEATVNVLAKDPIYIKSLEVPDQNFSAELVKLEDGHRYKIVVTPKSTAESQQAKLKIVTSIGKDEPRVGYLILQVY